MAFFFSSNVKTEPVTAELISTRAATIYCSSAGCHGAVVVVCCCEFINTALARLKVHHKYQAVSYHDHDHDLRMRKVTALSLVYHRPMNDENKSHKQTQHLTGLGKELPGTKNP